MAPFCLFFFSCQGYPAAVLAVIEKGNALVNNNNKKIQSREPGNREIFGIKVWWAEGRLGGRNRERRWQAWKWAEGGNVKSPEALAG